MAYPLSKVDIPNRIVFIDRSQLDKNIPSPPDSNNLIRSLLEEIVKSLRPPETLCGLKLINNEVLERIVSAIEELRQSIENNNQTTIQSSDKLVNLPQLENQEITLSDDKNSDFYTQSCEILGEKGFEELKIFLEDIPIEQRLKLMQNDDLLIRKLIETQKRTEKECRRAVSRLGTLQTKILLRIYEEVSGVEGRAVKWSPSQWFGEKQISSSDRANWSKALGKLKDRKLIEEEIRDNSKLSEPMSGNSSSYICLTSAGVNAAKWLIFRNSSLQTG